MTELERLEALLDDLHRQMCDAYDTGDMERWERLWAERDKVGRRWRELIGDEDDA